MPGSRVLFVRATPTSALRWLLAIGIAIPALLLPVGNALAATVTAELIDREDLVEGEDLWDAVYTLTDGSGIEFLGGVTILFPLDSELELVGAFSGGPPLTFPWLTARLVADPNLLAPGVFDNLLRAVPPPPELGVGIFIYTGSDPVPTLEQRFLVYDSSLETVEEGTITLPEASGGVAGLCALGVLFWIAGRARGASTRKRALAASAIAGIVSQLVPAGTAGAGAEPLPGVVIHSAEVDRFTIEFQPTTVNRLPGAAVSARQLAYEYSFDVAVTNNGAPIAVPFTISAAPGDPNTIMFLRDLTLPPLGTGQAAMAAEPLLMTVNRQFVFQPQQQIWCVPTPPGTDPQVDDLLEAIDAFILSANIDKGMADWRENLPMPPCFRGTGLYKLVLNTNFGPMEFELLPRTAPAHISSTVFLTRLGFYDTLNFHRVIPGFVAQGGDPRGDGTGGPGYQYGSEFDVDYLHDKRGVLSMAHGGQGTDGSQFFITFAPVPSLDLRHTVFGELTSGGETLDALEARGTPEPGVPTEPLIINSAQILVE